MPAWRKVRKCQTLCLYRLSMLAFLLITKPKRPFVQTVLQITAHFEYLSVTRGSMNSWRSCLFFVCFFKINPVNLIPVCSRSKSAHSSLLSERLSALGAALKCRAGLFQWKYKHGQELNRISIRDLTLPSPALSLLLFAIVCWLH